MSTTKSSAHWDHMVYHLTNHPSPISGEAYTITYLLPKTVIYKAKRYEKKPNSKGSTDTEV